MNLPDPDGAGPEKGGSIATTYDAFGNVLTETDALGNTTSYGYDEALRLVSITDANDDTTHFQYDLLGRRTKVTDPLGNETEFIYDGRDQVVQERITLDGVTYSRTNEYDIVGNLIRSTDRDGRVRTFSYDALHQLTEERWYGNATDANADSNRLNTISYSYDLGSRLVTMADNFSSYGYTYDELDRTLSTTAHHIPGVSDVTLTNTYDRLDSLRSSVSATIGGIADFLTSYTYDDQNRVTRIEQTHADPGGIGILPVRDKRVDFAYTDNSQIGRGGGQFDQIVRYNDLAGTELIASSSYTYDDQQRLTSLLHSTLNPQPSTLASYTWTFDDAGRVTQFVSSDGTANYTYDDTNQLTGADYDYQTNETYTYDANGNRITHSNGNTGGSTQSSATGDHNRITTDGTYNYEYDAEGNRTKRTTIATGEVIEYQWDAKNHLTRVTKRASDEGPVTSDIAYTYDVLGRRISKRIDEEGDGTFDKGYYFVYDESGKTDPATGVPLDDVVLVFADSSGSGPSTLDSRLLHGPAIDQILATEDVFNGVSDDVLYALADNLGTVRDWVQYDEVTEETTVVNHLKLDAFGKITAVEDASGNPSTLNPALSTFLYAYTGRIWDADAELYYYRARWFDPVVGQFIAEDPIGFDAGDANTRRYVGNRSTSATDPSGLAKVEVDGNQAYWIPGTIRGPRGGNHLWQEMKQDMRWAIGGYDAVRRLITMPTGFLRLAAAQELAHRTSDGNPRKGNNTRRDEFGRLTAAGWQIENRRQLERRAESPQAAIQRMEQALVRARIAQAAYRDTPAPNQIGDWQLDRDPIERLDGFRAVVYRNGDGNNARYIVAFEGTNGVHLEDWINNIRQHIGKMASQYEQAIELTGQLLQENEIGPNNLEVIGHSLGGGQASAASLVFDIPATSFNGAPVHRRTVERHDPEKGHRILGNLDQNKIVLYRVDKEILTAAVDALPPINPTVFIGGDPILPKNLGTEHFLPGRGSAFARHMLGEMISSLESEIARLRSQ